MKSMEIFQAIFLGLLQGLTEFLPISSSGHLIIFPKLFGWSDQGLVFDVFLHLGSLGAVLVFFRRDWQKIGRSFLFWKDPSLAAERKLGKMVLLGILPAVFFALLLGGVVETTLRSPLIVAINLIFWGAVLGGADWLAKNRTNSFNLTNGLSSKKAILIGFFQALSLLPGSSRSGLSLTGGLFTGLSRRAAVKFSFLMSAPLILGAGIFEGAKLLRGEVLVENWTALAAGFVSAFLAGFLAIKALFFLAQRNNFLPFVIYRILLGIIILIFLTK